MNFFKNILAWSFLPLQAYDRRGQARVELQNLSGALADFEKAKELDAKTKNVDKNIADLKKRMAEEEAKEETAGAGEEEAPAEEAAKETPAEEPAAGEEAKAEEAAGDGGGEDAKVEDPPPDEAPTEEPAAEEPAAEEAPAEEEEAPKEEEAAGEEEATAEEEAKKEEEEDEEARKKKEEERQRFEEERAAKEKDFEEREEALKKKEEKIDKKQVALNLSSEVSIFRTCLHCAGQNRQVGGNTSSKWGAAAREVDTPLVKFKSDAWRSYKSSEMRSLRSGLKLKTSELHGFTGFASYFIFWFPNKSSSVTRGY